MRESREEGKRSEEGRGGKGRIPEGLHLSGFGDLQGEEGVLGGYAVTNV